MNCQDTKSIDIVAFLQKNGFSGSVKGSFIWYCSPFREEKTASFSVDPDANRWIDFGTGQKGDLLDLVKLLHHTDTAGALEILSNCIPDQFLSFSRANLQPKEKQSGIFIKHLQPIENKALLQYLVVRKIPLNLARRYTQEAYYTVKDKKYFSIAFRNDKGGFELRNKYSKLASSPKYYTTIQAPGSDQLNIFEGFFNFLSALTYYNVLTPKHNTIVLNSLSFLPEIHKLLANYRQINLFLDNDPDSQSGQKAANEINEKHPNIKNLASLIYPGYKDFNEFLISKNSK